MLDIKSFPVDQGSGGIRFCMGTKQPAPFGKRGDSRKGETKVACLSISH